jgi:hypothetical protein
MDPMIATKHSPIAGKHSRVAEPPPGAAMTLDVVREFHRRMAVMIERVQTAVWERGLHDVLGYATDYAFGQDRGVQTLVLKTRHKSSYVRLQWDTVMGDGVVEMQAVETTLDNAISELRQ